MLKEISTHDLSVGQDFLLSYWRKTNKPVSHWVEFVEADLYFVYFKISKKFEGGNREKINKMPFKNIRATFIEEK